MFPLEVNAEWYFLLQDAEALHVAPWDLARQSPYWRNIAQARRRVLARVAELRA